MASPGHDRTPSRQADAQRGSAGSSKSSVVSLSSSSPSTTDASSQTSEEEFYTQRSGSISRILDLFREKATSSSQDVIREEPVTAAPNKCGIDVATQTEMSWLQDQYNKSVAVGDRTQPKKKTRLKNLKSALQKIATVRAYGSYTHGEVSPNSYCPLIRAQWAVPERLQKLDILCKMEFKEDFEMFFEPLLKTIPRLGPPAILAYKPELPPHDKITKYWEKEYPASCEFCGRNLKPFPSLDDDDFNAENYEKLFCCPEFRKLFEYVHHEKNLIKSMYPVSGSICIDPHPHFSSEKEKRKVKEKVVQRIQERHIARTFVFMANEQEEVNVKQNRTVTYQLARHPSIKIVQDKTLADSIIEDQCAFCIDSGDIWTLPCLKGQHQPLGRAICRSRRQPTLGQQARMNVGIKLQVRIHEEVPKLRYFTDEDLFLLALIIKIRRLLSKIEICVNFPSIENWYKLKTPSYLATRAIKLLSLCQYYELGKDAISRITSLLNEPI
ncbi:glutamate-rich protein 6 isoform 5-T5 [Sarcophilus harrisii]